MAKRTVKATKAPADVKELWVDADGYLVYGIREKNEWVTVAKIPQVHVELLCRILYSQPDLLSSLKELSKVSWMIGNRITLAGSLPQQIDQIKVRAVEAIAKYTEGEGAENGETKS